MATKGWQGPTPRRLELAGEVQRLRDEQIGRGEHSWERIALDLGISRSYASELYIDPDGSKSRARKDSYARPCPDCGDPMSGSDGLNAGPAYCVRCAPRHAERNLKWTHFTVIDAFRAYHDQWGHAPPSNHATILYPSQREGKQFSDVRLAEAAQNTVEVPHPAIVKALFGSWSAAVEAAGLPALKTGGAAERPHERFLDPEQTTEPLILSAIRDGHRTQPQIAEATGVAKSTITVVLLRLYRRGQVTRRRQPQLGVRGSYPYAYRLKEGFTMPGKTFVVLHMNGHGTWTEHRTEAINPEKAIENVANGSPAEEGVGIGSGSYVALPETLWKVQPVGEVTKLAVLPEG